MISLNFGVVGRELFFFFFIEMKGLEDLLLGGICFGECFDLIIIGFIFFFVVVVFLDFCKTCNGIGLNDFENRKFNLILGIFYVKGYFCWCSL